MGLTRYAGPRQYVGDGPEEARQQGSRGSLAFPAGGGGSWTKELCWPPTVCPESTHAQGEKGCLSHDHDKCDLLFCFILFSFGLF